MSTAPQWDPQQYLRHSGYRTRPFLDLLARVPRLPAEAGHAPRIADLGCGPGNVTTLLFDRWPDARVTGLDNSAEMLESAKPLAGPTTGGGHLDFRSADILRWAPDETYDLIASNAALQWVPGHVDAFPTWLDALRPGGSLAFQIPGNFDAPSHRLLRELCASPRWRDRLGETLRHRGAVLDPVGYQDRLAALGCEADVWETTYVQVLSGPDPVLDWVKGTGLRPVLTALADDPQAAEEFTGEYRELLREAYPPRPYGTPFPFRRIFVVARKRTK
ncbi:trans-aconitate 2-methyltransferase [Streptomyces cucumeris]|uniref:trans-aconitate 2-methyltransferase n=1 Tax=Streptomyces cucumeris TaxID=2962890 RepID=UPI0020C873EE|nr:trans-aconitate 2-methyltransferase [Streptomyces sp. NEAU-Y11]MCP9208519.1 trans-aconitate 2-methyltransferase [Streptomyces sp. NEAU-Y11]